MSRTLVATIHIEDQCDVILDGPLSATTYFTLLNLIFPDGMLKNVFLYNEMVAKDPEAVIVEVDLIRGRLRKPYPKFDTIVPPLPWFKLDGGYTVKVEVRIYNRI